MRPRRIAVISATSGQGKTTIGQLLAAELGVPFVELDALVHGPGWVETPDETLRARIVPMLAPGAEGWVIEGNYFPKLGTLVLDAAELVVWIDLPLRVWLPRLARRTWRRMRTHEELWNGNHESFRNALWGWDSLFLFGLRMQVTRRRTWPALLRGYRHVRLRSPRQVERFLAEMGITRTW